MTECVDCRREGVTTVRPAPYGGPRSKRCTTHHRAWRKRSRALAHGRMLQKTYDITPEQYWALYEAQGGRCFVCRVASGKSKRLCVEHEHGFCDDHPPERGCPKCIRALTCGRCNRLVAFLGVEALARAIRLISDPPARRLLTSMSSG